MDNRRRLPLGGTSEPRLSTSAVQPDHECELRQVSGDPGDSVSTTRVKKEEPSEVPRKIPRFQYVDYPSLHQCIKQLSVPPLEGWLASCPLGKATAHIPNSPEEKVPKFKYVDYPSLYHCIQQLSVPPLEIWSSELMKPSSGGMRGPTVGQQSSPQALKDGKQNEDSTTRQNEAEQKCKKEGGNGSMAHEPVLLQKVVQRIEGTNRSMATEKDKNETAISASLSCSKPELSEVRARNQECLRPSVISLVRTERQKRRVEPEGWVERQRCLGLVTRLKRNLQFVCTSCQETFKDPEELQTHWCDHKDRCPDCLTIINPVLDTSGQANPPLQSPNCPASMPVCEHCLYPCPTGTCTNQSCHIVSVLLKCDQVTDQTSKVAGCPQFRACPKCHSLMMHTSGCKYVTCVNCKHGYCFICLRSTKECRQDGKYYWSLTCSAPRAARQTFQT